MAVPKPGSPLTPAKTRSQPYFSNLFCFFYRREAEVSSNSCIFHNHRWLKNNHLLFFFVFFLNCALYFISDFVCLDKSQNCRHYEVSPLLCSINTQNRVSELKVQASKNNLKITRNLHENSSCATTPGGEFFYEPLHLLAKRLGKRIRGNICSSSEKFSCGLRVIFISF